jgi:hypothetical protein
MTTRVTARAIVSRGSWSDRHGRTSSPPLRADSTLLSEAAEQRVMMALFIKTLNSLQCFYELAMRGYFIQSLNLLRTPVEDWMGYWFLRNFPGRHGEFTAAGSEPPEFNVMLQAIESLKNRKRKREGKPAVGPGKRERVWMKQFHQYSHLSRVGVRAIMTIDEEFTNYHLRPEEDEGRFRHHQRPRAAGGNHPR